MAYKLKFMKKYIISIILSVISFSIYAQQEAFTMKLDTKTHRFVESSVGVDGSLNYMFKNKNELEVIWLKGAKRNSTIVSEVKNLKKLKMLGMVADSTNLSIYFYDTPTKLITQIAINKSTGSFVVTPINVLTKADVLLKGFEMDGVFYIMWVPFGQNILKFAAYKQGQFVVNQEYNIEFKYFWDALIASGNDTPQDSKYGVVNISEVDNSLPNSVINTAVYQKVYHYNHKFYITCEEPTTTHLIVIDPVFRTNDYRKLNFKLENESNKAKGNSFLINNRLLRLTASTEQINLCVVDLDSFTLVKNHNIYANQPLDLKNSPIFSETNGRLDNEIPTTKEFFNDMVDGNPSIVANNMGDNLIEVAIGSHNVSQQFNQMMGSSMAPSMMMYGVGWGFGYNPYMFPGRGYAPSYSVTTINNTQYFKSLFDNAKFNHLTGLLNKNVVEKIRDFERANFGTSAPDLHVVYSYGNKIHYGYYIDKSNLFVVREFSK